MNDFLRHLLTSDDSSSSSQNYHISRLNATYNPPLSDLANARRFAAQFSNKVRFVPAYGWFLFDGRRWHLGDSDQVLALAAESLQSYYNEALSLTDKQTALCKRLLRHAERSQSLSHLNALLQIASTLPGISAQHTLFDADPYLCSQEPNQVVRAHELYSAYHLWSRSKGLHRLTETAFGRLMRTRHFRRSRDATGNLYHGLALSLSLEQLTAKLANSSSL